MITDIESFFRVLGNWFADRSLFELLVLAGLAFLIDAVVRLNAETKSLAEKVSKIGKSKAAILDKDLDNLIRERGVSVSKYKISDVNGWVKRHNDKI